MSETKKRDWKKFYVGGPAQEFVAGIAIGSKAHKILLAMRATGRIHRAQIAERLGDEASHGLGNLKKRGLVLEEENNPGVWLLTEAGRALVVPGGPLCARKTLQTYCQL